MLVFPCAQCAKQFQTMPEWAGKKVKCPNCGHEMLVPAAGAVAAATPPANEALTAAALRRWIQDNQPVPPHQDCLIQGDVLLTALKYEHKLALRNCTFQGHVDATDSQFLKTLDLSGCTFEKGISFAGASVDCLVAPQCKFLGPVDAREVRFGKSVDLRACAFDQEVKFPGTRIAGDLVLTEASMRGPEACFELVAIDGNLLARGLQTQTKLNFTNASVRGRTDLSSSCTGELFLDGTTLSGEVNLEAAHSGSLNLTNATIRGNLRCHSIRLCGVSANGELSGLTVSGQVVFSNAYIEGDLELQAAEIRGGLFCLDADILGYLRMASAKIACTADFGRSRFGQGLSFKTALVEGRLWLDEIRVGKEPEIGAVAEEASKAEEGSQHVDDRWEVVGYGLRVTNDVTVVDARIRGNLSLDGAQLGGNLILNRSQIQGRVTLGNTEIQQNLHFWSSLPDHGARVGHDLWLRGAKIGGELNLCGITIAKDLNLSSVVVKERLRLDPQEDSGSSQIGGSVVLSASTVTGGVRLNQINIGGDLNITAASLKGGLRARQASVSGKTDLSGADVTGGIDFTMAQLGAQPGTQLKGVSTVVSGGLKCAGMRARQVDFSGSQLAGIVEFQEAHIDGMFEIRDATIKGKLVCAALTASKAILIGLKVTGSVDFVGAHIAEKLDLARANIDGRLRFRFRAEPFDQRTCIGTDEEVPPEDGTAALDLKACFARVADFDDHDPQECRRLLLDASKLPVIDVQGFRFDNLSVPGDNYVGFLKRTEFDRTNYVLLENWLSNQGDSAQAENVFLAKRDRANREAIKDLNPAFQLLSRWWRFASKCFLLLAFRSIAWALIGLVVVGISCSVFATRESVRPKQPAAAETTLTGTDPKNWGPVQSLRMACHIHFPGAPVSLLDHWEPSGIILWRWPFDVSYQDYAHLAWGITYVLVLPMLGIGVLIKWSRRREREQAS